MLTAIEKHDNWTIKSTPFTGQIFTATRWRANLARAKRLLAHTFQIPHRCVDATLLMRHARDPKAHFNPGECSHKHQFVEIAEMADPEDLIRDLVEAVAERHVKALQHHFAERIGAVALRH